MKIIFLDIDGILNSAAYDRQRDWTKRTYIDKTRLPLLKQIVDATGAEIVLSSTWREHWNSSPELCDEEGRYINECFAEYGLTIYDKTPDLGYFSDRDEEIREWLLEQENVENYVIIDDCNYNWGDMQNRFVKTNMYIGRGLEECHVRQAIEILE